MRLRSVLVLTGLVWALGAFPLVRGAGAETRDLDYDTVEVAVAFGNPDYIPFDDGLGYALNLNKALGEVFFLHADYARLIFRVGGEIGSKKLSDWATLGAGVRAPLHQRLHLVTGASWQGAVLDGKAESGYALHLGVRTLLHERLEFNLIFSYLDLVIEDLQTIGEIYFRLTPHLDLGLRVRDYADWDYTSYEVGLRYPF